MLNYNSDHYSEHSLQNEETFIDLINENDFSRLVHPKSPENRGFGIGHIVRQYMSGVGVITERYVSDDDMLFYDSTGRSSDNYSISNSDKNSSEYLTEEEELREDINLPENCPCYEKVLNDKLKKRGFLNNIFTSVLNLKAQIYKILYKYILYILHK